MELAKEFVGFSDKEVFINFGEILEVRWIC